MLANVIYSLIRSFLFHLEQFWPLLLSSFAYVRTTIFQCRQNIHLNQIKYHNISISINRTNHYTVETDQIFLLHFVSLLNHF